MSENQKKVVDALKRFPAQKEGYIKITFSKSGAFVDTDMLTDQQETEIMKHLSAKQKSIVNN